MKILLSKENIDAIKSATSITSKSTACPEKTTIYFETLSDDKLYFIVKNESNLFYERTINTKILESGTISVSGVMIYNIIHLYNEPLLFTTTDKRYLRISEQGNNIDIPIQTTKIDKPIHGRTHLSFPAQDIFFAINDVSFAIQESKSHLDQMFSNVCILSKNGTITVETFQNCYGARVQFMSSCANGIAFIPQELVFYALPVIESCSCHVNILSNTDTISIECNKTTLTYKRYRGEKLIFDDLYNLISISNEIIVNASDIKKAFAKALAITDNTNSCSKTTLTIPGSTNETILIESDALGVLKSCIPCFVVNGQKSISISINPQIAYKALNGIKDDIQIFALSPMRPIIICSTTHKNNIEFKQQRIICNTII